MRMVDGRAGSVSTPVPDRSSCSRKVGNGPGKPWRSVSAALSTSRVSGRAGNCAIGFPLTFNRYSDAVSSGGSAVS